MRSYLTERHQERLIIKLSWQSSLGILLYIIKLSEEKERKIKCNMGSFDLGSNLIDSY